MRPSTVAALACASFLAAPTTAVAQTAAPAPPPPAADPGAAPAAPAKPRAKKPAAARPPAAVAVTNASKQTATRVVISAGETTASTAKPLAPKARTLVKLPKLKGCLVSVAATFEGEGQVEVGEFDVCKDKTIRFTD